MGEIAAHVDEEQRRDGEVTRDIHGALAGPVAWSGERRSGDVEHVRRLIAHSGCVFGEVENRPGREDSRLRAGQQHRAGRRTGRETVEPTLEGLIATEVEHGAGGHVDVDTERRCGPRPAHGEVNRAAQHLERRTVAHVEGDAGGHVERASTLLSEHGTVGEGACSWIRDLDVLCSGAVEDPGAVVADRRAVVDAQRRARDGDDAVVDEVCDQRIGGALAVDGAVDDGEVDEVRDRDQTADGAPIERAAAAEDDVAVAVEGAVDGDLAVDERRVVDDERAGDDQVFLRRVEAVDLLGSVDGDRRAAADIHTHHVGRDRDAAGPVAGLGPQAVGGPGPLGVTHGSVEDDVVQTDVDGQRCDRDGVEGLGGAVAADDDPVGVDGGRRVSAGAGQGAAEIECPRRLHDQLAVVRGATRGRSADVDVQRAARGEHDVAVGPQQRAAREVQRADVDEIRLQEHRAGADVERGRGVARQRQIRTERDAGDADVVDGDPTEHVVDATGAGEAVGHSATQDDGGEGGVDGAVDDGGALEGERAVVGNVGVQDGPAGDRNCIRDREHARAVDGRNGHRQHVRREVEGEAAGRDGLRVAEDHVSETAGEDPIDLAAHGLVAADAQCCAGVCAQFDRRPRTGPGAVGQHLECADVGVQPGAVGEVEGDTGGDRGGVGTGLEDLAVVRDGARGARRQHGLGIDPTEVEVAVDDDVGAVLDREIALDRKGAVDGERAAYRAVDGGAVGVGVPLRAGGDRDRPLHRAAVQGLYGCRQRDEPVAAQRAAARQVDPAVDRRRVGDRQRADDEQVLLGGVEAVDRVGAVDGHVVDGADVHAHHVGRTGDTRSPVADGLPVVVWARTGPLGVTRARRSDELYGRGREVHGEVGRAAARQTGVAVVERARHDVIGLARERRVAVERAVDGARDTGQATPVDLAVVRGVGRGTGDLEVVGRAGAEVAVVGVADAGTGRDVDRSVVLGDAIEVQRAGLDVDDGRCSLVPQNAVGEGGRAGARLVERAVEVDRAAGVDVDIAGRGEVERRSRVDREGAAVGEVGLEGEDALDGDGACVGRRRQCSGRRASDLQGVARVDVDRLPREHDQFRNRRGRLEGHGVCDDCNVTGPRDDANVPFSAGVPPIGPSDVGERRDQWNLDGCDCPRIGAGGVVARNAGSERALVDLDAEADAVARCGGGWDEDVVGSGRPVRAVIAEDADLSAVPRTSDRDGAAVDVDEVVGNLGHIGAERGCRHRVDRRPVPGRSLFDHVRLDDVRRQLIAHARSHDATVFGSNGRTDSLAGAPAGDIEERLFERRRRRTDAGIDGHTTGGAQARRADDRDVTGGRVVEVDGEAEPLPGTRNVGQCRRGTPVRPGPVDVVRRARFARLTGRTSEEVVGIDECHAGAEPVAGAADARNGAAALVPRAAAELEDVHGSGLGAVAEAVGLADHEVVAQEVDRVTEATIVFWRRVGDDGLEHPGVGRAGAFEDLDAAGAGVRFVVTDRGDRHPVAVDRDCGPELVAVATDQALDEDRVGGGDVVVGDGTAAVDPVVQPVEARCAGCDLACRTHGNRGAVLSGGAGHRKRRERDAGEARTAALDDVDVTVGTRERNTHDDDVAVGGHAVAVRLVDAGQAERRRCGQRVRRRDVVDVRSASKAAARVAGQASEVRLGDHDVRRCAGFLDRDRSTEVGLGCRADWRDEALERHEVARDRVQACLPRIVLARCRERGRADDDERAVTGHIQRSAEAAVARCDRATDPTATAIALVFDHGVLPGDADPHRVPVVGDVDGVAKP